MGFRAPTAVEPLTLSILEQEGALEFRERYLNWRLAQHPIAIAADVQARLIKSLQADAPWMLPMVISAK